MKRRKQIRRVKTTALNQQNGVADGVWEEKTVEMKISIEKMSCFSKLQVTFKRQNLSTQMTFVVVAYR